MPPSIRFLFLYCLVASTAPPLAAQTSLPPLALSDADKADLLSHNTEASVTDARAGLDRPPASDRRIHGEIGAGIGSSGMRTIYGAAAIPLGDNAGAVVSFEQSRYGRRR